MPEFKQTADRRTGKSSWHNIGLQCVVQCTAVITQTACGSLTRRPS